MILKSLKRRSNQIFLKNNYDSFINNSNRKAPDHLKSVLFIADEDTKIEEILESLKHNLGVDKSHLKFIIFSETKSKSLEAENHLTEKDFGWYGKLKEGYLKELLTNTYDLLINNSKIDSLYIDLLVLQVKAGLKVGIGMKSSENYDLQIQVDSSNTDVFAKELKKYLEILK